MVYQHTVPTEGINIPIRESFGGFKGLPAFGVSQNSLNPSLVLYPNHIEHRVMFKEETPYDEIELVDIPVGLLIKINFTFKHHFMTFTAWARREEDADLVLSVCKAKGVPLSDCAEAYLGAVGASG